MAIFKEIVRGDGSGIAEYYRVQDGRVMNVDYSMVTNKPTLNGVTLSGDLTMEDFGMDIDGAVETLTGEEISKLKKDDNKIVLCTTDYLYTDSEGLPTQTERGSIYEIYQGIIVDKMATGGTGGGGSSNPRSNFTEAVSELEQNISVSTSKVELKYKFVTTAIPNNGTAKLYVNDVLKGTQSVKSGETYSFDVSDYIKSGINYFTIKTKDSNDAEKTLDFIVNAIELSLKSSFEAPSIVNTNFDYHYKVSGGQNKTIHFILDDVETTADTSLNNVNLVYHFENLSHGVHTLKVYASTFANEEELYSNTLEYTFLAVDPTIEENLILSTFNISNCVEGDLLTIDYLVYDYANLTADVELLINGEKQLDVQVDRKKYEWNVSNYPIGTTTFSIKCGDLQVDKVVEVAKMEYDITDTKEGLSLYLTAFNRSNQENEITRGTWEDGDVSVQLTGFNWVSNGWIDNKLKFSGEAKGYIPLNIFENEPRELGKTIEFEFETHQALNLNSTLMSCLTEGKGFKITTNKCTFSSEQVDTEVKYNENNKVRVTFVIEPLNSNRLIKTYLNGVLSGLKQYALTDNFQHNNPVGITINPDGEEFDIVCIRVYDRALTSQEIVNNYIYDISDTTTKLQKYKDNALYDSYGKISYAKVKAHLPVLTITGPMPPAKGEKRTVKCVYENIVNDKYNFTYEDCIIDVQGTSSQYYPRKNWKIKFPEEFVFTTGAIPEREYTFKADFMESSHSHNVGTANLANTLYDELFPTQTAENGVRNTIYGFPCAIFHREKEGDDLEFYGTYMFNNDKGNNKTLGLTTDKSESWEYKNNTSDLCLFKTDDFTADDVADNLEARYPDKYTDYTAISKMYSWVVSCKDNVEKFKEEFEQHFNLHYCLVYRVLMELALLVDSRAKNMFMDTVDGEIWYPRFYDMDTCWGLNNEGELKWNYDAEIFDRVGSSYVWNDRGESVFWNLFETAFADEIVTMYGHLRNKELTYDNIVDIYVNSISTRFNEAEYNEDAQFKYIDPLTLEDNKTYLYAAQGSRVDHFKYIVSKRLKYLDSKYNYGSYKTDYATMRLYTKTGDLTLTTYDTEYARVKFGSSIVEQKVQANTPTTIVAPKGLEFNDTETIIYGAESIVDLGDLSDKYPGTVDISKCSKLQTLNIGSDTKTNTNLISLSLGNNPLLRKINIRNCSSLTGELDVSAATGLQELDARGTNISSVSLPRTSTVTTLYLPGSITTLALQNQTSIETLNLANPSAIKTLIIEKTNYDIQDLLAKCSGLQRLRMHFDSKESFTMPIEQLLYYTNNLKGIDDSGLNTTYPCLTGFININYSDDLDNDEFEEAKTLFKTAYPELTINYNLTTSCLRYTPLKFEEQDAYNVTFNGKRLENSKNIRTVKTRTTRASSSSVTHENADYYLVYQNPSNKPTGNLFLPSTYKGKPVLGINAGNGTTSSSTAYAFQNCPNLYSITIPDSYHFGSQCFEYNGEPIYMTGARSLTLYAINETSVTEYWPPSPMDGSNIVYGSNNIQYVAVNYGVNAHVSGSSATLNKLVGFGNFENVTLCQAPYKNAIQGMTYQYYAVAKGLDLSNVTHLQWNVKLEDCFTNGFKNLIWSGACCHYYNEAELDLVNLKYVPKTTGSWYSDALVTTRSYAGTVNLHNKAFKYMPFVGVCDKIKGLDGLTRLLGPVCIGCTNDDVIEFPNLEEANGDYTFGSYFFPGVDGQSANSFISCIIGTSLDHKGIPYSSNLSLPKLNTLQMDTVGGWAVTYLLIGINNLYMNQDPTIPLKIIDNATSFNAQNIVYLYRNCNKIHNFPILIDGNNMSYNIKLGNAVSTDSRKLMGDVTHFEGVINFGKDFQGSTTITANSHWLDVSEFTSLPHEDYVSILDNLYDISTTFTKPQKIIMPKISQAMLTEEEISIATEKGWNVVFA